MLNKISVFFRNYTKYIIIGVCILVLILFILDLYNIPSLIFPMNNIRYEFFSIIAIVFVFFLGYLLVDNKIPDKEMNKYTYNSFKLKDIVWEFSYSFQYAQHSEKNIDIAYCKDLQDVINKASTELNDILKTGDVFKNEHDSYTRIQTELSQMKSDLKQILNDLPLDSQDKRLNKYITELFIHLNKSYYQIIHILDKLLDFQNIK